MTRSSFGALARGLHHHRQLCFGPRHQPCCELRGSLERGQRVTRHVEFVRISHLPKEQPLRPSKHKAPVRRHPWPRRQEPRPRMQVPSHHFLYCHVLHVVLLFTHMHAHVHRLAFQSTRTPSRPLPGNPRVTHTALGSHAHLLQAAQCIIHDAAHCLLCGAMPVHKVQQRGGAQGASPSLSWQAGQGNLPHSFPCGGRRGV